MKRRPIPSIILTIICLLMALALVSPQIVQAETSRSARITQILKALDKAQTLSAISQVVKDANLTEQELKQLAVEIQKRPLLKKIETLKKQALASSKLKQIKKKPDATKLLQQKRLALKKTHTALILQSNKSVMKSKPARTTATATSGTTAPRATISAENMLKLTSATGGGSSSRINDHSAPVVGEEITIRGTGFGSTEGRVALILRRELYYFPVTSWNTTRIVCTVTDELESAVGDAMDGVQALLWVKLHGGETGPTVDTRILPNPERLNPVIESITPDEISPGQTFIIRGKNLVKYRFDRARVKFLFGDDISVQATVEEPDHEFIQAKIPDDYGGMQRTVCRLEVTNDLGRKIDQTVTFVPVEEILDIRTPGKIVVSSQPVFPIFLSVIGDTSRVTLHDIVLKNGWVVEDCVIDYNAQGINAGAYYVERPDRGDTLARAVIEAWADAYSRVTAIETLFIKGPRGVPYR